MGRTQACQGSSKRQGHGAPIQRAVCWNMRDMTPQMMGWNTRRSSSSWLAVALAVISLPHSINQRPQCDKDDLAPMERLCQRAQGLLCFSCCFAWSARLASGLQFSLQLRPRAGTAESDHCSPAKPKRHQKEKGPKACMWDHLGNTVR